MNPSPLDDPRIRRGLEQQLAQRRARIAAGERPLGWKVGFGAPAALQKLGLAAPLVGHLFAGAVRESGSTLSLAGWVKPVAEPEIAVHLARDLGAGADRATAQAAIAGLGPAIELADLAFPPDDVERILAANIYQRAVIVAPCACAGGAVDGVHGRIVRNGEPFAETRDPQAQTGDLVDIVRHVADTLAACGERLRAGELIITGSIVPPLFVAAGEELAYALDPLGALAVRFAAAA